MKNIDIVPDKEGFSVYGGIRINIYIATHRRNTQDQQNKLTSARGWAPQSGPRATYSNCAPRAILAVLFSLFFGHEGRAKPDSECPKSREKNQQCWPRCTYYLLHRRESTSFPSIDHYCTSGKKHSFSSLNAFTRKIAISHLRENKWTENMKCGLYFT